MMSLLLLLPLPFLFYNTPVGFVFHIAPYRRFYNMLSIN